MKVAAVLIASLSVASAFAPSSIQSRPSTKVNSLFDDIAGMDLWTPKKEQNNYGARSKKNLKQGKITGNSYVPSGLSAAEYEKIRERDQKKKENNYAKNVAKAFKFEGFDEFYEKRGTDLSGNWVKDVTKGHRMVKTKYDYSGTEDAKKFESEVTKSGSIFGGFGKKK